MSVDNQRERIMRVFNDRNRELLPRNDKFVLIHQLFDSLHDFGKFSVCYDTITMNRNAPNQANKYSIQKMIFSILTKHCFKIFPTPDQNVDNDIFCKTFSNLMTPNGNLQPELSAADLENYMVWYAIKNNTVEDEVKEFTQTSESGLEDFFKIEGENINIIVDTQKLLYKRILNRHKGGVYDYNLIITQESMYDPASKKNIRQPTLLSFIGLTNVYEETPEQPRTYVGSTDVDELNTQWNKIEGIYDITLSGDIHPKNGSPAITVMIGNSTTGYSTTDCRMNSSSKHPNCISFLNKEIIHLLNPIYNKPADLMTGFSNTFYTNKEYNNTYNIYDNNNINRDQAKNVIKKFTQKRCGDALQGLIAGKLLHDTRFTLNVKNAATSPTRKQINNLVVVTIDRMLFAYCIKKQIPTILDNGKSFFAYKPTKYIELQTRISRGGKLKTHPSRIPDVISGELKHNLNNSKNKYKGGNKLDTSIFSEIFEIFTTSPYLLFRFVPFILEKNESINYIHGTDDRNNIERRETVLRHYNAICQLYTMDTYAGDNIMTGNGSIVINSNNRTNNDDIDTKITELGSTNKLLIYTPGTTKRLESVLTDNNTRIVLTITNSSYTWIASVNTSGLEGILVQTDEDMVNFLIQNGLLIEDSIRGGGKKESIRNFYNIIMNTLSDNILSDNKLSDNELLTNLSIIQQNALFVYTYLWTFKLYEGLVCLDEEQIKIDFDNIYELENKTPYYVPTHKCVYFYIIKILKILREKRSNNIQFKYLEIALLHKDLYDIGGNWLYYKIQEMKDFAFLHSTDTLFPQEYFGIENKFESLPANFESITKNTITVLKKALLFAMSNEKTANATKGYNKLSNYSFLHMYYDLYYELPGLMGYKRTFLKTEKTPSKKPRSNTKNKSFRVMSKNGSKNRSRKHSKKSSSSDSSSSDSSRQSQRQPIRSERE